MAGWYRCALAGALLLVLSALTFPRFPAEGHDIEPGYGSPVYAFEMARSPLDLQRIFGPEGDPKRDARIKAMDVGNLWDYPFMLAYGLFLWTFFAAAAVEAHDSRWRLFGLAGWLAAAADAVENQVLLALTPDLDSTALLAFLRYPVWFKFAALGIAVAGAAWFLSVRDTPWWRVAGFAAMLGCAGIALAAWSPGEFSYLLGMGIGLAWVLQFAYALARSFRPGRKAA